MANPDTIFKSGSVSFNAYRPGNLSITCPADIIRDNDLGVCGANVAYDEVKAATDCGYTVISVKMIEGISSGKFFPVGNTTVTYTATSSSGNSVSCSFTVTVTINELPTAVCVPGINPAGNEPSANNQDGYYTVRGYKNCSPEEVLNAYIMDSGSDGIIGTSDDYKYQASNGFPNGTVFKYVKAPGAPIKEKLGSGDVDWKLTGNGNAYVIVTDKSGKMSNATWCGAYPSVRRLRGIDD